MMGGNSTELRSFSLRLSFASSLYFTESLVRFSKSLLTASKFHRPSLAKSPFSFRFAPWQYGQLCLLEQDCNPTRILITLRSQTTPNSLSKAGRLRGLRSWVRFEYVSGTPSTLAATNALRVPVLLSELFVFFLSALFCFFGG